MTLLQKVVLLMVTTHADVLFRSIWIHHKWINRTSINSVPQFIMHFRQVQLYVLVAIFSVRFLCNKTCHNHSYVQFILVKCFLTQWLLWRCFPPNYQHSVEFEINIFIQKIFLVLFVFWTFAFWHDKLWRLLINKQFS